MGATDMVQLLELMAIRECSSGIDGRNGSVTGSIIALDGIVLLVIGSGVELSHGLNYPRSISHWQCTHSPMILTGKEFKYLQTHVRIFSWGNSASLEPSLIQIHPVVSE